MTRIVCEQTAGEFRAVALTPDELPFSLFIWRDRLLDPRPRVGDVIAMRVSSVDRGVHGMFLTGTETREIVFSTLGRGEKPPNEGARLSIEIVSESRADKHARGRVTRSPLQSPDQRQAFHLWMSALGVKEDDIDHGPEAPDIIDQAIEEAIAPSVTLTNGGQVHVDVTRAMTVFDVDSSGRQIKGGAQSLNMDAVKAVSRQIALRRTGGIVVMDLAGLVKGEASGELIRTLRAGLNSYGLKSAHIMPVNALGLLSFSLPHSRRLIEADKEVSDYLAAGLRALTRSLRTHRSATCTLRAGSGFSLALSRSEFDWRGALIAEFGARFFVETDDALVEFAYEVIP